MAYARAAGNGLIPSYWKGNRYIGGQLEVDGITYADGGTLVSSLGSAVIAAELTFTEEGAGTYTGSVTQPAGSTLLNVIVHGTALWDAATSASLKVGDATDDDGYYASVNLKATDLLAGESLSFFAHGGKAGAYIVGTVPTGHWESLYSAAARTLSAVVTSVGAGTAGRTRVTFVFSAPSTGATTEATFVSA